MIKVEKNIPIPTFHQKHRQNKYPWLRMEVGDSFSFDAVKYKSVLSARLQAQKKHGTKYSIDRIACRVWRIA